MFGLRKIIEKFIEGIMTLSGMVTTVTILLIVVFLFKEGAGLFNSPSVEKGYVLCVNASNPVEKLSNRHVVSLFNHDIENWNAVGGNDLAVDVFRFDEIFSLYGDDELGVDYENLPKLLGDVLSGRQGIIAFVPEQYLPKGNVGIKILKKSNIALSDVFGGAEWLPTATPAPLFGILPLIAGTLWVSFFAIVIALPLGLGVAIYLSELAGERVRKVLKPSIELMAGIPSVVYGFFGLVVLVPLIQQVFGLPVGETGFAGSCVLAIMALPTIITVAEDAMRNTPQSMREASLALGATHWQTIYKVVVPYASSGITAAVVLGMGRAIGETMAVLMVTGNAAVIPTSLFEPLRTIPATIAAELGEAPAGGAHYQALFLLGGILFVITLVISVLAEVVSKRHKFKGV